MKGQEISNGTGIQNPDERQGPHEAYGSAGVSIYCPGSKPGPRPASVPTRGPHLVLLALGTAPGVWRWLTLHLSLHRHLEALQLQHTFAAPWAILGAEDMSLRQSEKLGPVGCRTGPAPVQPKSEEKAGAGSVFFLLSKTWVDSVK